MTEKLRQALIIAVSILVMLTVCITSLYFYSFRLDEPIILKHYVDQKVQENGEVWMYIHYITDKSYNDNLYGIEFYNLSSEGRIEQGYSEEFKYYDYHVDEVKFYLDDFDMERLDNGGTISLKDAKLKFSRFGDMHVDIGEIVLKEYDGDLDHFITGHMSTNRSSQMYFREKDQMTLTSGSITLPEEVSSSIEITFYSGNKGVQTTALNNVSYPIRLITGSSIVTNMGELEKQGVIIDKDIVFELEEQIDTRHDVWLSVRSISKMSEEKIRQIVKEATND